MFQAIVSICNLLNLECIAYQDTSGLNFTKKQCIVRTIKIEKDLIETYGNRFYIKKDCIKLDNFRKI